MSPERSAFLVVSIFLVNIKTSINAFIDQLGRYISPSVLGKYQNWYLRHKIFTYKVHVPVSRVFIFRLSVETLG